MRVTRVTRVELVTYGPNKLFDITDKLAGLVEGVEEGVLALQAVGSTGALVILPEEVREGFESDLWDLVPTLGWRHLGNAYAHLRSTLIDTLQLLPVVNGRVPVSGRVYFLENQPALNRRRAVVAAVVEQR